MAYLRVATFPRRVPYPCVFCKGGRRCCRPNFCPLYTSRCVCVVVPALRKVREGRAPAAVVASAVSRPGQPACVNRCKKLLYHGQEGSPQGNVCGLIASWLALHHNQKHHADNGKHSECLFLPIPYVRLPHQETIRPRHRGMPPTTSASSSSAQSRQRPAQRRIVPGPRDTISATEHQPTSTEAW